LIAYTAHITMRTYQRCSSGATSDRAVAIALLLKVPAPRLARFFGSVVVPAAERVAQITAGADRGKRIQEPGAKARHLGEK
jgi:hypothetical protein